MVMRLLMFRLPSVAACEQSPGFSWVEHGTRAGYGAITEASQVRYRLGRGEHVAEAGTGDDVARRIVRELLAQAPERDAQDLVLAPVCISPDPREQLLAAQDDAGIGCETGQEAILRRGEAYLAPRDRHFLSLLVDPELAELDRR